MGKVFLIILIISGNSTGHSRERYPMPSWEKCIESVEKAVIHEGYESETNMMMFCIENE